MNIDQIPTPRTETALKQDWLATAKECATLERELHAALARVASVVESYHKNMHKNGQLYEQRDAARAELEKVTAEVAELRHQKGQVDSPMFSRRELLAKIANARGWIMANTTVPAHDILKALETHEN